MQNRNLVLFLTLSMAMLIGWNTFVVPRLLPPKKPGPAANAAKKDAGPASVAKAGQPDAEKIAAGDKTSGDKKKPEDKTTVASAKGEAKAAADSKKPADAVAAKNAPGKVPEYVRKTIVLGSSDPDTGYFLQAELTSRGAAVASVEFNDPRYRELDHTKVPLKIVGNDIDGRFHKADKDRALAQADHDLAAEKLRSAESVAHPGEMAAEIESDRVALQAAAEKLKQAERNVSLAQTT